MFRIVQEALTNVVRHSQAHNCTIKIQLDDKFYLRVTDDGRGLPVQLKYGIGLKSMTERAEEIGGTLRISSQPDVGTVVLAELPI